MEYIPDNYDQYKQYEADCERWLAKRPICSDCEEPIQDDYCYKIGEKYICSRCLEDYYREEICDIVD